MSDDVGVTAIRALARSNGYVKDCEVTPAREPARNRRKFVLLRSLRSVFICFELISFDSKWMILVVGNMEHDEDKVRMRKQQQHKFEWKNWWRMGCDGDQTDNEVPSVHVDAKKFAPLLVGRKLNGCIRNDSRHCCRVATIQTSESLMLIGNAKKFDDSAKWEFLIPAVSRKDKMCLYKRLEFDINLVLLYLEMNFRTIQRCNSGFGNCACYSSTSQANHHLFTLFMQPCF